MRYTKKRMSRKTNLGKRRKSYARKYKARNTKKRGGTYGPQNICEGNCMRRAISCNKGRNMNDPYCKTCVYICKKNLKEGFRWDSGQNKSDVLDYNIYDF